MNLKSFVLTLTQKLNWHKDRCETFASMVVGLVDQHNVQHHAFTRALANTKCPMKSKLERIRRFFAKQIVDHNAFALQMVTTIFKTVPKMDLILDRTNWKFGRKDINILVLVGRVGPVVFPLFWSFLDHQGCSNADQRSHLLEQFKQTFGLECILSFTADREFVGQDWLTYLSINKIPFYIRLKDNRLIEWGQNKKRVLRDFFEGLAEGEDRSLYALINQQDLLVVGKKHKGEYVVVCSNVKKSGAKQSENHVMKSYRTRWSIERCFKDMKTQGFNLEKTHMTSIPRLMILMCAIAIGLLMASLAGIREKCPFKKTVNAPLYSFFTRGFRFLKNNLLIPDIGRHFEENVRQIIGEG